MPTNGRLDLGGLAGVDHFRPLYRFVNADVGSNLLTREARDQLRLLQQAFEDALGRPLYISEAYRSFDAQVDAKEREAAGGNLAAYPGTSNHGWAESCDFGSGVGTYGSVSKVWMDEHAPDYGWEPTGNSFRRREGWHFDYVGNPRITTASSGAVVIDTPAPESEEDDMFRPQLARNTKTKRVAYFFPDRVVETENEEQIYRLGRGWNVLKAGQKWTDVVNDIDDAEYNATVTEINASRTRTRREYVKAIAQGVWDHVVGGWNGKQSARNRLAGIDEKAGHR